MQVEHVAGVGFATRRTAQQQRHLAIGPGLLGQIVVDDQRVLAAVAEVLAHGTAGVRGDVLHGRGFGGRGGNNDGVVHCAVLAQLVDDGVDRRGLLSDGHIDTFNTGALLIDDGVDGHRRLAGLAVADDQLALTAADWHHGIDRLETGLHRLVHRLAPDDTRRNLLDRRALGGLQIAFAVDRLTQRVDHASEQVFADRYFQDALGAADGVAFRDVLVCAHDHRADRILLQVQRQTVGVAREFDHFAGHHVRQPVNAGDAVGEADHGAFRTGFGRQIEVLDLLFNQFTDFCRADLHGSSSGVQRPRDFSNS